MIVRFLVAATAVVLLPCCPASSFCYLIPNQDQWSKASQFERRVAEMDLLRPECQEEARRRGIEVFSQARASQDSVEGISEPGFDVKKVWSYACPNGTQYRFNFDKDKLDWNRLQMRKIYQSSPMQDLTLQLLDFKIAVETDASAREQLKQSKCEIVMQVMKEIQQKVIGQQVQ